MATTFTHRIGKSYTNDAGQIASTVDTFTGNSESNLIAVVPASATNHEYDLTCTVDDIQSMVIYSTLPLTLKTNSSSAPDDTITTTAKVMIEWDIHSIAVKPFTVNVVKIYVTNVAVSAVQLDIRCLLNV